MWNQCNHFDFRLKTKSGQDTLELLIPEHTKEILNHLFSPSKLHNDALTHLIGGWSSTGRPRADMRSMLCCWMSWIARVVARERLSHASYFVASSCNTQNQTNDGFRKQRKRINTHLSELSTSRSCWPFVQSDRINTEVKYFKATRRPVGCPVRNPSFCIPSLT